MRFEYQWDENSYKVVMELPNSSTLPEAVEAFDRFLKAAGYVFDGTVDIVDSEEEETNE